MEKSEKYFKGAQEVIPGGVNSPARAFSAVDSDPLFIEKGQGSKIYDVDGNEYIDYVGSWGPMILGYNHPQVVEALEAQIQKGTSFGAPTEIETELASLIVDNIASIDKVRMVNSGTEATMSAIRLARGYTGRDKILKLEGCYHGHGDSLLIDAGSGLTTLGIPSTPGVPANVAQETLIAPYNDLAAVEAIFAEYGSEIAGVILEPVTGNMGVIAPQDGYLEGLRELTDDYGAVLIFDEVMTGFRLAYGGAQELYGIEPDLTTFGKIIGGGLPVGAYGGKVEIMSHVAPEGPVYQAGTLSGNPLAMAAGAETLRLLLQGEVYEELEEKASKLAAGIKTNIEKLEIPATISRVGSMVCLFFNPTEVTNYQDVKQCDTDAFALYFQKMLEQGVYLPPSQFEANFVSLVHTDQELEFTIEANYKALKEVKRDCF
ncbi:glutamate-1-semialdehyde 2,1-aminomutase [Natroniella acetigena]|uniref:glutamate-1-semialdehyde 2,1-aminomutase n=1 Tax=Natroniella acetigena TaxID=52004 RepID=UPI00200B5822|nr:glutamate-1-semialdehyde 2,1-aminomutase [Natroniella acetigena]MCK8828233.1 glutamate-1-semialdehyde 2,1-aminomutase [Natroniella acetigena]